MMEKCIVCQKNERRQGKWTCSNDCAVQMINHVIKPDLDERITLKSNFSYHGQPLKMKK